MDTPLIEDIKVSAYKIPTDYPESDGTFKWDSTTIILVEIQSAGFSGLGYTYADASAGFLVEHTLKDVLLKENCMNIASLWNKMERAIRNNGYCGLAQMAVSAIDVALWDLKAKIFDVPLVVLLGAARTNFPIYGSGGFTSYPIEKLQQQLSEWSDNGFKQVKMKIGRDASQDVFRVQKARDAIGEGTQLFVDANGAYEIKEAIDKAAYFADLGVHWLEEPVPHTDLEGLHFIRKQAPASMVVASGEYGYNLHDFKAMLQSGAVDVLQADATRCGGITGFLKAARLCEAFQIPFSSHCAPSLHLHAGMACPHFYTAEYFYDHVRIEQMLFDGVQKPRDGALYPDLSRPGMGLEFKRQDASKFEVAIN